MMQTMQLTATSPCLLAPSQTTPLVAAAKNPLGMTMGTSRFAGSIPKTSASVVAPKAVTPKASWNRELDFNGSKNTKKTSPPAEKKVWVRHNKRRVPRAQAPTRNSGPCNPPASTGLSRAAAAVAVAAAAAAAAPATPSESPTKAMPLCPSAPIFVPRATAAVVKCPPTPSAPSSPTTSADSSEPPVDSWKENSKVKRENIIYLQRLFKEGLKNEEIAKRTAAEFPDLCKGMRNGCKTATEETRVEAVGDAVFMHTRRYAIWYV